MSEAKKWGRFRVTIFDQKTEGKVLDIDCGRITAMSVAVACGLFEIAEAIMGDNLTDKPETDETISYGDQKPDVSA